MTLHWQRMTLHQQCRYITMIIPLTLQFDILVNRHVETQPQVGEEDAGEDCVHDCVEDTVPREGGAETAQSKKGKTSFKTREKVRKSAGDTVFGDCVPLHSATNPTLSKVLLNMGLPGNKPRTSSSSLLWRAERIQFLPWGQLQCKLFFQQCCWSECSIHQCAW